MGDMTTIQIAKRYASALFLQSHGSKDGAELVPSLLALVLFLHAQENKNGDRLEAELLAVKEVFQNNQQVHEYLTNPDQPREEKLALLDKSFKDFSSVVKEMLVDLAEQNRLTLVTDVVAQFVDLYGEVSGVVEAVVTSVYPITDEEKERISTVFAKKLGKKGLRIRNEIEPELLGGITIRVEDKFFDASVVGKIKRLQHELTSG